MPRNHEAPWLGRSSLAKWFGTALEPQELHRAKLLASELLTNAVLHGQGKIVLRAKSDENRLLVEVIDEGHGFKHAVRKSAFADLSGRGLWIVDAESSRWGIHEGTTHVWFELERQGPRLGTEKKPPA
jgi:anti-sigma regulatory factor (Ser/Thr protein kinase)